MELKDKYENIYEFDLTGFFDNVDLEYLSDCSQALGIPEAQANWFKELNQKLPKLPEELLKEEPDTGYFYDNDDQVSTELR
jgi:hypothetical protein